MEGRRTQLTRSVVHGPVKLPGEQGWSKRDVDEAGASDGRGREEALVLGQRLMETDAFDVSISLR